MEKASYYREQAERARRLARGSTNREVVELLEQVAQEYANLAEHLESGLVEARGPERMPQRGG